MKEVKKAFEVIQKEFQEKYGVEVDIKLHCYSLDPLLAKRITSEFGKSKFMYSDPEESDYPTSWHDALYSSGEKNCRDVRVTCFHDKYTTKDVNLDEESRKHDMGLSEQTI